MHKVNKICIKAINEKINKEQKLRENELNRQNILRCNITSESGKYSEMEVSQADKRKKNHVSNKQSSDLEKPKIDSIDTNTKPKKNIY
jgi:hypothetical protein